MFSSKYVREKSRFLLHLRSLISNYFKDFIANLTILEMIATVFKPRAFAYLKVGLPQSLVVRSLSSEVPADGGKKKFGPGNKGSRKPFVSKGELVELWKLKAINESAKLSTLPGNAWPKLLNSLVDVIVSEVKAGKSVLFTSFGKFSPAQRAARTVRDPSRPGNTINVEARETIRFKASKKWSEEPEKKEKTPKKKNSTKKTKKADQPQ